MSMAVTFHEMQRPSKFWYQKLPGSSKINLYISDFLITFYMMRNNKNCPVTNFKNMTIPERYPEVVMYAKKLIKLLESLLKKCVR